MTTIATDGKSMAADRRVSGNGTCHGGTTKIARAENGAIVGVAGNATGLNVFLDWYNGSSKEPFDGKGCFEALVLTTHGTIWSYDEHGRRYQCEAPQAIGSGDAVAYGAMDAGATPFHAVEIACRRDTNSGDGVDELRLDSGQAQ